MVIAYSFVTPFQRLLTNYEIAELEQSYEADVTYQLKLPIEQIEPFTEAVTELTNGDALVEVMQLDQ